MEGQPDAGDVRKALALGRECLARQGLETPHLDAELLLAHILGLTRTKLYAELERPLSGEEARAYQALLARRRMAEPIAYILGHKEFYGHDFLMDRRVLIPRPETELLVEQAVALGKERGFLLMADIGTGSGCIAISLALELPQARLFAVDSSVGALEVAASNLRRHGVEKRVQLIQGDLLGALPQAVDMIVSNPPYISQERLDQLPREVADYEPWEALDGGCGGLEVIGRILAGARERLKSGGALLLEIDAHQGQAASALAKDYFPLAEIKVFPDYAGLDRVLMVREIK